MTGIFEDQAHQAIARELPMIREQLVAMNEWLDSINANVMAFFGDEEETEETIFTSVELPLTDEDLQALVAAFAALSPGDQRKLLKQLKEMEAALDG